MNNAFLLVSTVFGMSLSLLIVVTQPTVVHMDGESISAEIAHLPIVQSDSVKKQPVKLRPAPPTRSNTSATYSAPGHYTVTVPRENGPGGKADLILVNDKKQVERISDVNSNDIESIEVFKDARTIARYKVLYGDIAAKGVVIIRLKSNKTL